MRLPERIYLVLIILFAAAAGCRQQNPEAPGKADIVKTRTIIEDIDKQFSRDFYSGDSAALAGYYSDDARLGSLKGNEILSFWGKMIQNSVKDSTRNLVFRTTAFTGDSVYMVELGTYEFRDERNDLKSNGRYAVVWKQENGEWKIYRDIGL